MSKRFADIMENIEQSDYKKVAINPSNMTSEEKFLNNL